MAACTPQVVEKIVEKPVIQTVVVEKAVEVEKVTTVIVEKAIEIEKKVVETVIVEKAVEVSSPARWQIRSETCAVGLESERASPHEMSPSQYRRTAPPIPLS